MDEIILKKVCVHNLKGVNLTLPTRQLIVFTGVSGSGKSSLAFDTLFVEGQRRYIESLSTYARRYIGGLSKPDAELIEGISPTIAIEQKTSHRSPRSTVGTMTGIYDFLRILYAKVATAYCPVSGERVTPQSAQDIVNAIIQQKGAKVALLSPYITGQKGEFREDFQELAKKGFVRLRVDGEILDLSEPIAIDGNRSHTIEIVIDRLTIQEDNLGRLKESIASALEIGKGILILHHFEKGEDTLFSTHAYSVKSGLSYPSLESHDFSFNHPSGMCSECEGLGTTLDFDLKSCIDEEKSISEDCFPYAGSYETVVWGNIYRNLARLFDFSLKTPWKKLPQKARDLFLYGHKEKRLRMTFENPKTGAEWSDYVQWNGVLFEAKKRFQEAKSDRYRLKMQKVMKLTKCPSCRGSRLKPYPSAAKLGGLTIQEMTALSMKEGLAFFNRLKLTPSEQLIGEELIKECVRRLEFLLGVGLHYLCLERESTTLSGGESQRVRLASQIGSGLVGTTYILDEPSIGLHPIDNEKLIVTLRQLRDQGNTVIVVEHDEETIYAADHIVDVGPGAGSEGGEIVAQGDIQALINAPRSITGAYLSGKSSLPQPKKRRAPSGKSLKIVGATEHNLKNLTVEIPLEQFVCITGVSGSGKSTLIFDILAPYLQNELHKSDHPVGAHSAIEGIEHLDKVITIDQSPIGRTSRSNPGTYIKLLDDIRDLFASLPSAQAMGFKAGRFSFNVAEGSCPKCRGMGEVRVDMDFLEETTTTCDLCEGKRYDPKTLSITFKGKNIDDILQMAVEEALLFFDSIPHIAHKLKVLSDVGLTYMKIGQPSTTLSGGEAQRIKLAKELIRPATGKTLYILDEPTTGLHFEDERKLITILHQLVDHSNSVLIIEHNMDLVRSADWVIDLGPEGGKGGGHILATGTPEQIAKSATATGRFLKAALAKKRAIPANIEHTKAPPIEAITVKGASQNNLKHIDVTIPRGQISVFTGPSGSGKTSLAFETIYAEGQRRYIESLSTFARQFVKQMPKPKLDWIEGLSPAISVEQKKHAGNPRSTIGTMTEIVDFLRLLYAHQGQAYCPETGEEIRSITLNEAVAKVQALPENSKVHILSPLTIKPGETFNDVVDRLKREGFLRVRLNGEYFELDQEIPYNPRKKNALHLVVDRLIVKKGMEPRLFEACQVAAKLGQNKFTAALESEDLFFNLDFAVPSTGKSYPKLTPQSFSFNSEEGMCPECHGLGIQWGADLTRFPEVMQLTPLELMMELWKERATKKSVKLLCDTLAKEKIDPNTPLEELPEKALHTFLNGSTAPSHFSWIGLNPFFNKIIRSTLPEVRDRLIPSLDEKSCFACKGERLAPLPRLVKLGGLTLPALCAKTHEETLSFIQKLEVPKWFQEVHEQIAKRLEFLCEIGLDYLSLARSAPSLSGGETQRIHLARQLGSGLTGCLYVLDEPTIGLHPHNNERLNRALKKLRNLGNTLLLVEHDPLTIEEADYLFDFGPKAGKEGGQILAHGTIDEIKRNPQSLTGAYLSGKKRIPIPTVRRPGKAPLKITNAKLHNLKNLTLDIPSAAFTCISGVSGSGKSTLMHQILKPAAVKALSGRQPKETIESECGGVSGLSQFSKVIFLDQSPIGHTNRADVTTYSELLTPLRQFFAELPEAKIRALLPYHFSYNHLKGMCRKCWGLGHRKINLQLLPSVEIECDSCHGQRLNPLSLQVTYKGKNLGQILNLTVEEAIDFLPQIPKVVKILNVLKSVGLSYLKLGQEIQTLSGGEAQRLRLSRELIKRSAGKVLYLFDEPTVGLHSEDIATLLPIFQALVDKGHTLVMIEHNLDILASADYLIDLGPDAGVKGGKIVATGTPEEVAKHPKSYTGRYLKDYFNPKF